MLHTMVVVGSCVGIIVIWWYGPQLTLVPSRLFYLIQGIGQGAVFAQTLVGLCIQIHNATTLSNMLVQTAAGPTDEWLARFREWKETYKVVVGSMHVWSWRVTPLTGNVIALLIMSIVRHIVTAVFGYTHIMSEPDIPESKRFSVFLRIYNETAGLLASNTLLLLVLLVLMAMVSSRYTRLGQLVATQRGMLQNELEDFLVLQKNAALTVFDVPITVRVVRTMLRFAFFQAIVVALSAASGA